MYFVTGTYEDGYECEEMYADKKQALTRAGYLIEGFNCSVEVFDEDGNEYPVF